MGNFLSSGNDAVDSRLFKEGKIGNKCFLLISSTDKPGANVATRYNRLVQGDEKCASRFDKVAVASHMCDASSDLKIPHRRKLF